MTTRLLLVDDHPAILLGLRCIFEAEPDLEVVGACQEPTTGYAAFTEQEPDVVVLDLSMPGEGGLDLMRRMRRARPDASILVLTSSCDSATVTTVLRAGANGYLLKDCSSTHLVDGLRAVLRGEVPVDARATRFLVESPAIATGDELTQRESQVLRLVGLGLANKQIATRLGIGESTVKTHLSSVFQRIGVSDRTSAALWARANLPDVHALPTRPDLAQRAPVPG